jgi:soluble lytic murein transglycosylase-like protein
MKVWLSCVIGAVAAVSVAAMCRVADTRSDAAPSAVPVRASFARASFARASFANDAVNTTVVAKTITVSPNAIVDAAFDALGGDIRTSAETTDVLPRHRVLLAYLEDNSAAPEREETPPENDLSAAPASAVATAKRELPYLKYYVYSELPPPEKPAKIAVEAYSNIPLGTPIDEIKRAADAFGLDDNFLKAVAKVESDFKPSERTGSYIGLFQLSRSEFKKYGTGDITNPRDNAIAAAAKFVNEATLFESVTEKKPTYADLYLIHQQGWEGAAEHISHPQQIAWKSMCSTDEGMEKGERWCKKAIWWNTLPAVKREWKSVDRLTSGAFVAMWRDRIDHLYARYAEAPTEQAKQLFPSP